MTKVVLFGDSITAGYFDEAVSSKLTKLVKDDLEKQGYEGIEVLNAGIPGDTSQGGVQRLEKDVLSKNPDFVTIFFGANDCSDSYPITPEDYKNNLIQMIEKIGRDKVILFSPPFVDTPRQPNRAKEELEAFVEKAEEAAAAYNLPIVNMYRAMTIYPGTDEFLQTDGLHFSQYGYDFLAALIVREIKGKLLSK